MRPRVSVWLIAVVIMRQIEQALAAAALVLGHVERKAAESTEHQTAQVLRQLSLGAKCLPYKPAMRA